MKVYKCDSSQCEKVAAKLMVSPFWGKQYYCDECFNQLQGLCQHMGWPVGYMELEGEEG